MTAEWLAGLAGVLLTVLFTYIPGLREKYAGFDSVKKSLIMLGLLVVAAGAVFGLSCIPDWAGRWVTCDRKGLLDLLEILGAAAVGNVTSYVILPQPGAVRAAKATRQ